MPFFFQPTSIEQLTLITPLFLPDNRGYLAKTFESGLFASQGISFTLAEELDSTDRGQGGFGSPGRR